MKFISSTAQIQSALACLCIAASLFGVTQAQAETVQTVRIAVAHYSDQTLPYFQKMAKEFNKTNPGITIKIEEVNWDNLQQKLQTDISSGTNPDLSIVGTRWLLDLVKDDVLEPLAGHMTAPFKDRFIGEFLNSGNINGQVYGLPIAASARGLYYNKIMLKNAGFPNGPKTWDDVFAASKKIKANGAYGFGLQGKEIETEVYWFYALWSQGGTIIDANGKAVFDSAAGIKAASMYKELINQGLTQPGVTSYSREDVQNLFKQGRVAMVITAPFLAKQIQKENPALQYGVTAVPGDVASATYATTDSLVMFKNSKVKAAAWKFADFLFSKAPRVTFTSSEGFLPTTKEEASDPVFADDVTKEFIGFLPTAKFPPVIAGWEDLSKILSNALQSIYLGKTKPDVALKAAAAQTNHVLKK
ncbi:ABC-type sugar transport system periplasmic component [Solimicrobium silvestre]|uniref:ABC-type sugar transport system periplasmic component n=2 Tax=Solimicrobium silvestre TaxID=2099400 RepID=A0A2S9GXW4_9BURK|nr:ABC-type sugar transport system periplasmic component [Solimicrobium silvestre]